VNENYASAGRAGKTRDPVRDRLNFLSMERERQLIFQWEPAGETTVTGEIVEARHTSLTVDKAAPVQRKLHCSNSCDVPGSVWQLR
jgi:hypothetical protein